MVAESKIRVRAWLLLTLAATALSGCGSGESTRTADPPVSPQPPTPQPPVPPPAPPTPPAPTPNPFSGFDTRPSNTTCLAWARTTPGSGITLMRYTAHTFASPVALLQAPAQGGRHNVLGRNLDCGLINPLRLVRRHIFQAKIRRAESRKLNQPSPLAILFKEWLRDLYQAALKKRNGKVESRILPR